MPILCQNFHSFYPFRRYRNFCIKIFSERIMQKLHFLYHYFSCASHSLRMHNFIFSNNIKNIIYNLFKISFFLRNNSRICSNPCYRKNITNFFYTLQIRCINKILHSHHPLSFFIEIII